MRRLPEDICDSIQVCQYRQKAFPDAISGKVFYVKKPLQSSCMLSLKAVRLLKSILSRNSVFGG